MASQASEDWSELQRGTSGEVVHPQMDGGGNKLSEVCIAQGPQRTEGTEQCVGAGSWHRTEGHPGPAPDGMVLTPAIVTHPKDSGWVSGLPRLFILTPGTYFSYR